MPSLFYTQPVAFLVIVATFILKSYEATDVFTETFKQLPDTVIIRRAYPVNVAVTSMPAPQAIPANNISPLPATFPDPAPEQLQSYECPQYAPIIIDGHQLLHITEDEIFYHLTTYPLTQSLQQSIDCYFMNG